MDPKLHTKYNNYTCKGNHLCPYYLLAILHMRKRNGYLRMRKYSPRPVFPVDRPTYVHTDGQKTPNDAVTIRLRFAARVNNKVQVDQRTAYWVKIVTTYCANLFPTLTSKLATFTMHLLYSSFRHCLKHLCYKYFVDLHPSHYLYIYTVTF